MIASRFLGTRFLVLAVAVVCFLPACKINVKKDGDEKDKKVDISTPIGGIHVSKGIDPRDLGLAIYPGARPKKDPENDKGANVHISSPYFGLKVVAQEYESDDSAEKLVTFYSDQLKKYGNVIECHGKWKGKDANVNVSNGSSKKSHELTCDKDNSAIPLNSRLARTRINTWSPLSHKGKGANSLWCGSRFEEKTTRSSFSNVIRPPGKPAMRRLAPLCRLL
jgi:hypothetical protein